MYLGFFINLNQILHFIITKIILESLIIFNLIYIIFNLNLINLHFIFQSYHFFFLLIIKQFMCKY